MMRQLREVNVDNNTVGWFGRWRLLWSRSEPHSRSRYQSTYLGSYQTQDLIDTFVTYQAS